MVFTDKKHLVTLIKVIINPLFLSLCTVESNIYSREPKLMDSENKTYRTTLIRVMINPLLHVRYLFKLLFPGSGFRRRQKKRPGIGQLLKQVTFIKIHFYTLNGTIFRQLYS